MLGVHCPATRVERPIARPRATHSTPTSAFQDPAPQSLERKRASANLRLKMLEWKEKELAVAKEKLQLEQEMFEMEEDQNTPQAVKNERSD